MTEHISVLESSFGLKIEEIQLFLLFLTLYIWNDIHLFQDGYIQNHFQSLIDCFEMVKPSKTL